MIQIGKDKFVVKPPTAMRSWSLQQRIFPIAGNLASAITQAIGASGGKLSLTKILAEDIIKILPVAAPALGRVFASMPPEELEAVFRILLNDPKAGAPVDAVTTMNGAALFTAGGGDSFDLLMQGRHIDMWKLVVHAMEVWYPDFFGLAQSFSATATKARDSEGSTTSPPSGPANG